MTDPELGVGAVVVDDDRLLLVRRRNAPGPGTWSVPGGSVRGGETLAEAVTRELLEETGLEGVCGPLMGLVEVLPEEPAERHVVVLGYEVSLLGPGEPVAGDDATAARWVPLADVTDLVLAPGLAEFLHDHAIIETIT